MVHGEPSFRENFEALASLDGRFFDQDRFKATEGRLPDPDTHRRSRRERNRGAAVPVPGRPEALLGTFDPNDISQGSFEHPPAPKLRMTATIVGIGLFPEEVVQDDTDRSALMLLTPAYTREALPYVQYEWQGLVLRRGDRDVDAFKQRYVGHLDPGSPQFFRVTSVTTFHTQQAVRPLSIALGLFGAIAFLAVRRARRARAEPSAALRERGTRSAPGHGCSAGRVERRGRDRPSRRGARGRRARSRLGPCCVAFHADREGPRRRSRTRASTPTGRCSASARSSSSRSSGPSSGSPPGGRRHTGVPPTDRGSASLEARDRGARGGPLAGRRRRRAAGPGTRARAHRGTGPIRHVRRRDRHTRPRRGDHLREQPEHARRSAAPVRLGLGRHTRRHRRLRKLASRCSAQRARPRSGR